MKIIRVETWRDDVPLARPYAISSARHDAASLFFVRLVTDGAAVGLGSCTPVEVITGESAESCGASLVGDRMVPLEGSDARLVGRNAAVVEELLGATPAARAAVDMALHDLFGKVLDVPLVDLWGRCHAALPTSITIGIKGVAETLEEAEEYWGRGFRCLKVKLGHSLVEDLERLHVLRERFATEVRIRVDANGGYTLAEARKLVDAMDTLDLELVEQPLHRDRNHELPELPVEVQSRLALDESVHDEKDAIVHGGDPAGPGLWVLKLMKCGGVSAAGRLAAIAHAAGRGLMWGCMDESKISIAAALHLAYSSPATTYLDLDGSFDLSRDPAQGGFSVSGAGVLELTGGPGLGVQLSAE